MTDELAIKAFEKAIKSGRIKHGAMVHTDRGSQYVSNFCSTICNRPILYRQLKVEVCLST
jgi:transposase InsO family protein